ncbi:hypothetical protein DSO57_1020659 [Entomophthora muscae]|uniref:Uncharacterized protein n=1 Tax=Entomophthora muscae TaxID=34485 RepID=A0ACC2SH15_9FUNG|nr:hypothetical protein DSO57_1020659 [Entomophthora muscae]
MIFNSNNIFDGASSQASFNGGKAQGADATVYTHAFEAGNKEANLYLTPDPYGFDLFSSHVVNATIHHVLILPLSGYFKDKSLFCFCPSNEASSELGNTIVQFPDSAQLTCPTHACG